MHLPSCIFWQVEESQTTQRTNDRQTGCFYAFTNKNAAHWLVSFLVQKTEKPCQMGMLDFEKYSFDSLIISLSHM